MNTVNASTGFSGFQLCMGWSLCIIHPLVPFTLPNTPEDDFQAAIDLINRLQLDINKATNNLLAAKISQAHQANKHRNQDPLFEIGNCVLLFTFHYCRVYTAGHKGHVTKFMSYFNGPYTILDTHYEFSTYTLDLSLSNVVPTFHILLLRKFVRNDLKLFPSHKFKQPGPILTTDGLEEYFVKWIINESMNATMAVGKDTSFAGKVTIQVMTPWKTMLP